MRQRLFAVVGVFVLTLVASCPAFATGNPDEFDYPERDEINQTVQLSPGATVRITDISGPVTVETASVSAAEIHVVRSARSREELEHKKITVDATASSLTIQTERVKGNNWDRARVRQRVVLRIPRNVSFSANDIAGRLRVGEIDGPVRINDVAGAVDVAQALGSSEIFDIAGALTVSVVRLDGPGLKISDIAGRVELRLGGEINANLNISDIAGRIDVDVPNLSVLGKVSSERLEGQIGSGGAPITVFDVAGSVTIRKM